MKNSYKIFLLFGAIFLPLLSFSNEAFFIKNEGQILDKKGQKIEHIIGLYKGKSFDVFFQNNQINYVFKKANFSQKNITELMFQKSNYEFQYYRMDIDFLGANPSCKIKFSKQKRLNHRYLNNSSGEIKIDNGYQEILYENIYDGIDLKFYLYENTLKYDFIVHPKGNYENIKMKYIGADNIINQSSKLIIENPLGILEESIPEIYQETKSEKSIVEGNYHVRKNEISFELREFNRNQDLIIDPWSTFIGGVDIEEAYSVFIDGQKNTYTTGYTGSANFPTTVGALEIVKEGQYDAFLTKLDTTGNLIWSTFYGGVGDEFGYQVVVDSDDNPYLIGYTNGNDILVSTSGVFQTNSGGSYDSFILKLDSAGNFVWATYFGGTGGEFTISADIDNSDNILVGGFTSSTDMPTLNPFQGTMGGALDAFIAKFDTTGNLIWSTYCGGSNSEDAHVLKTDNQNNVIISGETFSSDFPVSSGAFQSGNNGNLDVFLTKYDSTGNRVFSTYFGGLNAEDANGLTTDINDNIYLVGYTASNDFPMIGNNIYQNIKNAIKDGFIAKFSPLGQPIRTTFIGGSGDDIFTSAEIGLSNTLNVGGYTGSSDMPIIGIPYQPTNNGLIDGIYYHLDTALTPNYSTYIGGASTDYIRDLKEYENDLMTFVGFTSSSDFPVTSNVAQTIIGGQSDAFVFQADSTFDIITNLPNFFSANNLIDIYPNPFSNIIHLTIKDFNKSDDYEVSIFNVEGKKILCKSIYEKNSVIEFEKNLKSGIYFLEIFKNNQIVESKKLLKKSVY